MDLIRREALFLYRPYGRALAYVFVGLLVMCKGGFLGFFVGLVCVVVGIVVYLASKSVYISLKTLRTSIRDEQQLLAVFSKFDINRFALSFVYINNCILLYYVYNNYTLYYSNSSGSLSTKELSKLCKEMGTPLSLNELESALLVLDVDGNGKITYDEFLRWYNGGEKSNI